MVQHLEAKILSFDKERVIKTTLGYGAVGLMLPHSLIMAPLLLATGYVASVYDESREKKYSLREPALYGLMGGVLGTLFPDPFLSEIILELTTYVGFGSGFIGGVMHSISQKNNRQYAELVAIKSMPSK